MKRFQRLSDIQLPVWSAPLALLVVAVLAYGLMINRLGFYWDDWAFVWISQKLGAVGLARYFSTNRPIWGLLYQLTTPILGSIPWHWQVFGLFWHWAAAVALWQLVRLLWTGRENAALWISILFLIYPGFDQQAIAITYGHFYIVMTVFLLSLCATLLSLRRPKYYGWFVALALVGAAVNLLMLEYFFLLELLRPVLIWMVIGEKVQGVKPRLRRTLVHWLPYLLLFIGVVLWRAVFFRYQTQNYSPVLFNQLRSQPVTAVLHLGWVILRDAWTTSIGAWMHASRVPSLAELGSLTLATYGLIILLTAFFGYLFFSRFQFVKDESGDWAYPAIGVGLAGLLLAGWPYWLTGLDLGLDYPLSRFTLSFALGASFLVAGLLRWLPLRNWMRLGVLAVLVGFAVGMHYQEANAFRRDWNAQKSLFWQMAWRMPGLKPGTVLLFNNLPLTYDSDNTLTSPLNYIYAPDNHTSQMGYMLYFPTVRVGRALLDLLPGLPIEQNYLAARFSGNTSQSVALNYSPPGCLRVLDEVEAKNSLLPDYLRQAATFSNLGQILSGTDGKAAHPPEEIFGSEPAHTWCYFYQKADLARQQGDWRQVAALGDQAFALNDYPNDPAERLLFIEGYAHASRWDRALELTHETIGITPLMQPALCSLWARIDSSLPSNKAADEALLQVGNELACP